MSTLYYLCDVPNRTCFEMGKHVSAYIRDLCEIAIDANSFTLDEFLIEADKCISFVHYDLDRKIEFFNYLSSLQPSAWRIVDLESMVEEVFDISNTKLLVHQVGTVWSNCDREFVFGKQYIPINNVPL